MYLLPKRNAIENVARFKGAAEQHFIINSHLVSKFQEALYKFRYNEVP